MNEEDRRLILTDDMTLNEDGITDMISADGSIALNSDKRFQYQEFGNCSSQQFNISNIMSRAEIRDKRKKFLLKKYSHDGELRASRE